MPHLVFEREIACNSNENPFPDNRNGISANHGRIARSGDYQVALATFRAARQRWPGTPIMLRQGARVIEDSRRLRVV